MWDAPWHWALVALVAFALFGGYKKLPEASRSLGRSLRIFKTELKGLAEDDQARERAAVEPAAQPPVDVTKTDDQARVPGAAEQREAEPPAAG